MPRSEAKMPLDEFWKLVAELNWGHKSDGPGKTSDYKKVQKVLMQRLDAEGAERMSNTLHDLLNQLYKPLFHIEGMGDDGYGDFRAHIIGLGKEEFEKALANPKTQEKRAEKYQFCESFTYCIPHAEDYAMLVPTPHIERAQRVVQTYQKGLEDERYAPVHDAMRLIIDTFTPAASGNLSALLGTEKKLDAALEAIEAHREFLHREGGRYEDGGPMVHNTIGDIKQFLG